MKHTFKEGDEVVVLDTPNVRKYRAAGIGYKKRLTIKEAYDIGRASSSGGSFVFDGNQHVTNYLFEDIALVEPKVINEYQIY